MCKINVNATFQKVGFFNLYDGRPKQGPICVLLSRYYRHYPFSPAHHCGGHCHVLPSSLTHPAFFFRLDGRNRFAFVRCRLTRSHCRQSKSSLFLLHISMTISTLNVFIDISFPPLFKALLHLSCQRIDHCHTLITPLSWSARTSFGGDPIPHSKWRKEATYAHAMVHRMEGREEGEFGTGFNNSSYWWGVLGKHSLFSTVLELARSLAKERKECVVIQRCLGEMGLTWQPRVFLDVCESAVKAKESEVLQWCAAVQREEILCLAEWVLAETGKWLGHCFIFEKIRRQEDIL